MAVGCDSTVRRLRSRARQWSNGVADLGDCAAEITQQTGVPISVDDTTQLPFPEEFDGSALEAAVGPIEWTPLEDGIQQTIATLRGVGGAA